MTQRASIGNNEPQLHEEEQFLTVVQIADWLKLNQGTIRNWIDNGDLPAVRVGRRRVRVRRSDLDRYLEAGRTTEPQASPPAQTAEESEPVVAETAELALTPAEASDATVPKQADGGRAAKRVSDDPVTAEARERVAAAVGAALATDWSHTPAQVAGALRTLAKAAEELAADLEAGQP
jgi:excisionase family DNA binding protein